MIDRWWCWWQRASVNERVSSVREGAYDGVKMWRAVLTVAIVVTCFSSSAFADEEYSGRLFVAKFIYSLSQ